MAERFHGLLDGVCVDDYEFVVDDDRGHLAVMLDDLPKFLKPGFIVRSRALPLAEAMRLHLHTRFGCWEDCVRSCQARPRLNLGKSERNCPGSLRPKSRQQHDGREHGIGDGSADHASIFGRRWTEVQFGTIPHAPRLVAVSGRKGWRGDSGAIPARHHRHRGRRDDLERTHIELLKGQKESVVRATDCKTLSWSVMRLKPMSSVPPGTEPYTLCRMLGQIDAQILSAAGYVHRHPSVLSY